LLRSHFCVATLRKTANRAIAADGAMS